MKRNSIKRLFALVLAVVLATSGLAVTAFAKEPLPVAEDLTGRPKTNDDFLAAEGFNRYTQGNKMFNTGYFTETITFEVDGAEQQHQVYYYLAEGIQVRDYYTTIAMPEGINAEEEITAWLNDNGWFDKADEMAEGLVIIPAGEEGWGTPEEAAAVINAVMRSSSYSSNGAYFSTYGVHYFVGYEGGAAGMQLWAAENPVFVISQVYVDADADIAAQLEERGALTYGTADTRGNDQSAAYADVERKEVPIPTWFIGESNEGSVAYWKANNDCLETAEASEIYGDVFWQDKENSNALATSYTDVVSQVAVKADNDAAAEEIYSFLSTYTGYDNTSVYGNSLVWRLNWAEAQADGRLTIVSDYQYTDPTTDIVWTREYMVYIPENSKEFYPDGAPLVVVHSGGSQPDSLFFDSTAWWQIADEYGFMLLFPCSAGILTTAWNEKASGTEASPYDFGFTSELIDLAISEYGADPNRVYVTGQSMGCYFTQYCGSVMDEKLTALGATSGLIITDLSVGVTSTDVPMKTEGILPVSLVFGEYDYFTFKVGEIAEVAENETHDADGYFIGQNLHETYFLASTQTYWVDRNQVGPFDSYEIVNPEDVTWDNNTSLDTIVNPGEENGDRYTTYAWTNEDGVPLFEFTQCYGRQHNNIISDYYLIWETWFSKWAKDENGVLQYWADGVGNGTPVAVG